MSAAPDDAASRDDERPQGPAGRSSGSDRQGRPREADRAPRRPAAGDRKYSREGKPPFRSGKPAPREGKPVSRDGKPTHRDGTAPRDGKPTYRDGKPTYRDGKAPRDGKPTYRDGKPDRSAGADRGRSGAAGAPRSGDRGGRGVRPAAGGRDDQRLWTKGGKPARGDRDARDQEDRVDPDPFGTRSVRPHRVDPALPDDVTPDQLDRVARNELKTLTAENQEYVARHLAMAARLIDSDPQLAHEHAISASRRAGRIGIARETLAITAYTIGDFALALRELRTYRRISGRDDQLPMMVDCERGLGRPERALELGRSVPRASLPPAVQAELAIAMSGARLDLGQPELALIELETPLLDPTTAYSYSPGLFDAYATVLEELGRLGEAEEWFRRADVASAALQGDSDADYIEVFEEELAVAQHEVDQAPVVPHEADAD